MEIPSFGYVGRNGDVFLPTRTIRVAIPEGSGAIRIEGIRGGSSPVPGLKLDPPSPFSSRPGTRAIPKAASLTKKESLKKRAAAASTEPKGFAPAAEPVRLGDVGYFRDQKFVEVIYTPVVSPKGGGEALFFGEMDIDLVVEGLGPRAISEEGAPADPLFEDQYRRAFANYDEGRYFRVGSAGPAKATPEAAPSSRLTATVTASAGATSAFPAYKLTVSRDGIYRMSQGYLLNPSTGVAQGLAGADPREFKIMNRGVEIPIFVQGEGDGTFDAGDSIEFYGQRLDAPETILNYSLGQSPGIYQYDDYGDKNVYWLSVDSNGPRSRMAERISPPNGLFPVVADFQETIHSEVDNLYQPTGNEDPFLMAPRLNSNTGSVAADANTCTYSNPGIPSAGINSNYLDPNHNNDPNSTHFCPVCRVSTPGVNTAAGTNATVSVRMRGTTEEFSAVPDHMAVVELNKVPSLSAAICWNGLSFVTRDVAIPQASLTGASVDIRIEQPGLAATALNEQLLVDFTEVSYRRLFNAVSDGLRFTVQNQDNRIAVSALSTNNAANVEVLEISYTIQPLSALGGPAIAAPVRVTGGDFTGSSGNFTLTFTNDQDPNAPSSRTYHLAGPGSAGLLLPDAVVQDVPSTLLDPANEADVLVIGDPNVMDTTPASAFTAYWNHRTVVDGYVVKVVSILDIIDEFGYGINHPQAIRSFLEYAYTNWKGPSLNPNRPPPAFATIVGDTTADPKNNLNRSDWINHVPTFMMFQFSAILGFYASDAFIAAFHGTDQVPDIHLGRIPVRTAAESATVFQKLLNYETVFPGGSWRGHGTFICDEGKVPGESSEFARITDEVADGFWNPKPPFSATKIYYDTAPYSFGNDPTKILNDITAAQNAGNALLTYTGHGAFAIWGVDGWYFTTDVASLTANGIYSFMINENCLSGGFHALGQEALSETFLKAANKGAAAFFAPAGLSFGFIGEAINTEVYGDIFGPTRERRFGPLITDVRLLLGSQGSILDEQSYMLVGDPTSLFAVPAPKPPRSLAAVSGNAVVDLTWLASLDPGTKTLVYRATSPAGPYTLLTPSSITGTAYHDPNVVNAQTYFYETASVDAAGYEGRRSNFNSDCVTANLPLSGPDCVWAKPANPNAPATPSGAYVYDDGRGTRLGIAWTANPENDLANYVIRYGTQQGGPYPQTVLASPSATGITLMGLVTGTTYYVVLSARNTSAGESAPTPEMVGKPTFFSGQNPPEIISDLMIFQTPGDPNSLTLSWTKPIHDIYGNPTTIASFSIYRGLTPTFLLSSSSRIATITNPNAGSYTDPGAYMAPATYYYLITSTDPRGFTSGGGNELPKGIADLEVSLVGSTTVHFEWSPITQDVKGGPITVGKYSLYASDTPIPRTRIDTLTPVVDDIQTTGANVPLNSLNKYYSVIVVDLRGNKSPL